jgi:hypothetical protein
LQVSTQRGVVAEDKVIAGSLFFYTITPVVYTSKEAAPFLKGNISIKMAEAP